MVTLLVITMLFMILKGFQFRHDERSFKSKACFKCYDDFHMGHNVLYYAFQ